MDALRFDLVAKSHAQHARRHVLVSLLAAAIGLVAMEPSSTPARKKRKRRKHRRPSPPPPESPPPAPPAGSGDGRTICPPSSATASCPATDPLCCPRTSAINALCCKNGEQCCNPGLNGVSRCCPLPYDCCSGRTDTSDGRPVCCLLGCCTTSDDCTQDQRCSDAGCCIEACPNNTEVCFNDCCTEGSVCVTSSDGQNRQCCAAEDACPGSRTGCCGGLTCTAIENPQPGGPTHACVT